jgi:hypothetical protein
MSVNATITVSISPDATSARSSSRLSTARSYAEARAAGKRSVDNR